MAFVALCDSVGIPREGDLQIFGARYGREMPAASCFRPLKRLFAFFEGSEGGKGAPEGLKITSTGSVYRVSHDVFDGF